MDSEFMMLADGSAHIFSLGLCGPIDGQEFYVENVEMPCERPNDFVAGFVLPQLRSGSAKALTSTHMGIALVAWLHQFEGQALEVCYDWHVDRMALENLLQQADPLMEIRYDACPVSYLIEDEAGIRAADACWMELERTRGLRRHHALADALALRARFMAVHGAEAVDGGAV
ncbi:hypothetical protein [Paracidovorax konjaci]|uniref:hypothetical protein n=1 Tax=Paracidovorax konjaci TaxID=32040 RepID=UPI0015870282|nr:hypothetical protein [Paracidovorax konjaci]